MNRTSSKFLLRQFFSAVLILLMISSSSPSGEITPAAVLAGTSGVTVALKGFPPPLKILTADGSEIPFSLRRGRKTHTVFFPRLPAEDSDLRFYFAPTSEDGGAASPAPLFLPVIKEFRVVISFDDGPAQGSAEAPSSTRSVLDALDAFRHGPGNTRRGTSAVFFVLTSPDTFLHDTFVKGETPAGAAIMAETARRGHVLGVHWGGGYQAQTRTHPRHVAEPPTGPGQENRLEGELQQCADRIEEICGVRPEFVRPTLWVYADARRPEIADARPTYRRLGLKMTLTDAKYPDGGYKIISLFVPRKKQLFARNLQRAFRSGQRDLVFSMHDSNIDTARALPQILEEIKTVFDRIDFGEGRPNKQSAQRLRFAATPEEARDILRAKKRFVMFPDMRPAP